MEYDNLDDTDVFSERICGKQGCYNPGTSVVYGSLTYHACEEHVAEITELCDKE